MPAGSSIPPLNVRIVISASGAGATAGVMRNVTQAAGGMNGAIGKSAMNIRTLGDAMRQTGSLIKYSVIGGLVNMGNASIAAARNFELSMKRIQGLVGESGNQVQRYKDAILALGAASGKGPVELADALYFITSAGIKGAKAMDVLRESARSAAAGLGETKVVADALTSILNAYGQETYSASKANDILVATVREGKAEADQFAPALGKVLPIAAAFGASFEDVSAGVAALTRGGASAGTSAIYLRQVLSQLLKPSKQAAETMQAAGTSAADLRQRIQEDGLLNALSYLNERLGGSDSEVMAAGLTKVFGNVRALTAVFSLLGPNLEKNRDIFAELNSATGDAAKAFDAYSKTADYAFKKSAAEAQAAMIRVGDAIMPAVTALMELSGQIARVAETFLRFTTGTGIVGKFGKALMVAGAASVILGKGTLFLFLRLSSYVRLMGHGITVLRGFAGTLATANGGTITLSNSMRMLGFSTQAQTDIMAAARMATAAQTTVNGQLMISEQGLLGIMASRAPTQKMATLLTNLQSQASGTAKIALTEQAIAEYIAANATRTLGQSLMTAFPIFIGIATLAYTLATSFGLIGSGAMGDGLEGDKRSLDELNELLGITAGYAQSSLTVDIGVNITGDELSPAEQKNKLKDALVKSLGPGIGDALEAASTYGGKTAQINLAAAVIGQLDLSPEEATKMQTALGQYFNVDPRTIADAASTAGNQLNSAFIIAANTPTKVKFAPDVQPDYEMLNEIAANSAGFIADNVRDAKLDEIFENYGLGLSENLNNLDFGTFIQKIGGIQKATAGMENQSNALEIMIEEAFSSDNIDAAALGNQFKDVEAGIGGIFANVDNADNLGMLLKPLGVTGEEVQPVIDTINNRIEELGDSATEAQKIEAVAGFLNEVAVSADSTAEALYAAREMTYDAATEFKDGLNPAIQDIVDAYNIATEAIKNYEKGQESLAGQSQDFIQAQIDANEAAGELAEKLSKSGGKVGTYGFEGESYNALIKYKEEILNVANIMAADPMKGPGQAAEFFSQQWKMALDTLVSGGVPLEKAKAQLDAIGFSLTDVPKTWTGNKDAILNPLGDAYATDTALPGIGNDIVSGISSGLELGSSDRTAISKFNSDMVKAFKEDWGIKSPSRVSRDLGVQIKVGFIEGMTGLEPSHIAALERWGKMVTGVITEAMYNSMPSIAEVTGAMFAKEGGVQDVIDAKGRAGYTGIDYRLKDMPEVVIKAPVIPIKKGPGSGGKSDDTVYLSGAMGASQKKLKEWLDKLSKFSQATTEYISRVSSDSAKSLGYIGAFIDARLKMSEALVARQKLLIEQEMLAANLAKAQREKLYAAMRDGANLGRDVTGYEISRIEDLQKAYETASRDYAMKRGSYTAMIDAQIALEEARAAASETSGDAVSAETELLDAKTKLENKNLEVAKATLEIVKAQQEQVDAAIQLRIHMEDARKAFHQFAFEAIPNIITSIDGLGLGLGDPKGAFMTSLHGLGKNIFDMLGTAAKEAGLISGTAEMGAPETEFFPGPTSTDTGAGATAGAANPNAPAVGAGKFGDPNFGKKTDGSYYDKFMSAVYAIHPNFDKLKRNGGTTEVADSKAAFPNLYSLYKGMNRAMAKGGIVSSPVQALLGESGPEAVIPLQGYSTRIALQKLFSVDQNAGGTSMSGSGSSVYITVNNPVAETAEESISRRMKALSTSGLFR
jgi:TP901 family phage tail tape measure protein